MNAHAQDKTNFMPRPNSMGYYEETLFNDQNIKQTLSSRHICELKIVLLKKIQEVKVSREK